MKTINFGVVLLHYPAQMHFNPPPAPLALPDRATALGSFPWSDALRNYEDGRKNGAGVSQLPLPCDGTCSIDSIEAIVDDYGYGQKREDGSYDYEVRYNEGPKDRAWMANQDCRYLTKLLEEGNLREKEPDVWYLREMDRAREINVENIGEWWRPYGNSPNIDSILEHMPYLVFAEQQIHGLSDLNNIPEILATLQNLREALSKNKDHTNILSTQKVGMLLFELGNKCLNLPDQSDVQRKINTATTIACLIAANQEIPEEDKFNYKGFLIELMGLKLDHFHESLDELKINYPDRYHRAWSLINRQRVKLFLGGDTFSDRTFVRRPRMTTNVGIIEHGTQTYTFWQRQLPEFKHYIAQDDNQPIKEYRKENERDAVDHLKFNHT